jgi:hypothetical protein
MHGGEVAQPFLYGNCYPRWCYLLTLNAETIAVHLPKYATAVGKKVGMDDPSLCTIFGFLDGCFV